MNVIGLTGGIGSGKSTVAKMFVALGVNVVDVDDISHALTAAQGAAILQIITTFGEQYIEANGAMHRGKMRELIFSQPQAKQQLQDILYPLILSESRAQLTAQHNAPYAMLVVPLLQENPSFQNLVERVLVVDCDEQIQLARVMQRSHLTQQQVENIMQQQASRRERLALADDVIVNNQDIENLSKQVADLHKQYLQIKKH